MGIKQLRAVLRQRAPKSIHKIKLADLTGREVVFDASLYMYKWYTVAASSGGGGIKNREGVLINHIQGALFNVNSMRKHGILVTYVFDGKPPVEKAETLESRRDARVSSGIVPPNTAAWQELRTLLRLTGVQTIDAPGESDPYIAALTKSGAAYACATDDLDALTFGATRVITDIDIRAGTATMIVLQDVLAELGMNYEQFVDFCILLGSDYTAKTLPRIGPARSYLLMKKHKTIPAIIRDLSIVAPPGFEYERARAVFLAPPPPLEELTAPTAWEPSLKTWLTAAGVTGKRIDNLFA